MKTCRMVWVILTVSSIGCTRQSSDAEKERALPNVVLITLDTTRADWLGSYGRADARTETLDRLAAVGERFTRAYSPMPLTIPAHSTIFTGLEPHTHGVRSNSDQILEGRLNTMAEILHARGYSTGASVAAFVTQASWGFGQGFEEYRDELPRKPAGDGKNPWTEERPGNLVVDDALEVLAGFPEDGPFFLWTHLFDPHSPLVAPKQYIEGHEKDPYGAELAFVDDQVQRLVDAVGDSPTLWVIVGDHGEALGGHNQIYHGLYIYNDTQRVPWILSGAGIEPGVVDQPVGLADLLPTVLSRLDIPIPKGLDGAVQPGHPHPIPMETWELRSKYGYAPHTGLVDGRWKYIATPKPELYDQLEDLDEVKNLAVEEPGVVMEMARKLSDLEIPSFEANLSTGMNAETLSRLAALGYVSGGGQGATEDQPDPKDREKVLIKLQMASEARKARRPKLAIKNYEEAIALDPNLVLPRAKLAFLLQQQGRIGEGLVWSESALEMNPQSFDVVLVAIMLREATKDAQGAWELCEDLLDLQPHSTHAAEACMTVLFNRGQGEQAVQLGRDFLETHPEADNVSAFLGVYLASNARFDEARPLLEAGLTSPFPRRTLRQHLAMMWLAMDNPGQAMVFLRDELVDFPGNHRARESLVRLLDKESRHDEQLEQLDVLLAEFPTSVRYLHARAEVLLDMGDLEGSALGLEAAFALEAENADLVLLLANLLMAQGQEEEGQATFERAKLLKAAEASKR